MMSITPETGGDAARRAPAPSLGLLEAAIERGGLHPFFHAKVSMQTRGIVGAEALARIAQPAAGHAAPAPYVELAERVQRIDALTLVMARTVAGHVAGFGGLPCSINISPSSLNRPEFADEIAAALTEAGLPCTQFILELTQSRADYGPNAAETMTALREKGFGLSVDDFGAGAANIDQLRAYPFTEVKIDPAFTRLAMEEPFARAALADCVRFVHDHGLLVVAEGVETQAMWDFAAGLKIDQAQGFLIGKPMQADAFRASLAPGAVPQA